jgi:hypothetical protein
MEKEPPRRPQDALGAAPLPMMGELNALIDKAEGEGKWLWCHYQDLWFSPGQLREQNRNGKFRWGPVNWKLRDPQERIDAADKAARAATDYAERVRAETHG